MEDIQALIVLNNKKMPKQSIMAGYYARLTQIFAVSDNHLYHAYAWLKLFGEPPLLRFWSGLYFRRKP